MNDDFINSIFGYGRCKILFRCLKCGLRQAEKAGEACVACLMEEMRQFANDAGGPTTFDRARYARADGTASTGKFFDEQAAGAWFKSQRRTAPPPPPPPPPPPAAVDPNAEMLRRLIQLCHPDKHANSEATQKATRWLLDLKAKGGSR